MKQHHQATLIYRLLLAACVILADATMASQTPLITLSTSNVSFGTQNIGAASSAHIVSITNEGPGSTTISRIVLSGSFTGDFSESDTCGSLSGGATCLIFVSFVPQGTGLRTASLFIMDDDPSSPQIVTLSGTGAAACSNISDCAFQELSRRAAANQQKFFVYKDADSAFNHGIPSGLFGSRDVDLHSVLLDSACIDDPLAPDGCSKNPTRMDATRGTVFHIQFPKLVTDDFVGLNFLEPQNYDGINVTGNGYDLRPATALQLDVRSPDGARVQFGVDNCVTNFFTLGSSWTTLTIPINSLFPPSGGVGPCPPTLSSTHILFTVTTNGAQEPNVADVLLDNIQFLPVPARQANDPRALSLPLGNQTFGIIPGGSPPFPTDQANRGSATIYESALTILSLLHRGRGTDILQAQSIANALDYALHHDNHGDPLPVAPDGSVGLHNGYASGDIAGLNDQPSQGPGVPVGLAGDVRLAGFSVPLGSTLCGVTHFCLEEDGATGGNNAFAILALAAAYLRFGSQHYLADAETIGNWIVGTLKDQDSVGFGGYFAQFDDLPPHHLNHGKSTENNADIFAAFSLLAQIELSLGNGEAAANWMLRANVAGDFVMQMFDPGKGRFFTGTIPVGTSPTCLVGMQKGNDAINTCDFLDANSFTTLAMAAAPRYRNAIDWSLPLQYVLNLPQPSTFTQMVTANNVTFQGFDIVPAPRATGVAWEFTGQMGELCSYVNSLLNVVTFESCSQTVAAQVLSAQSSAPFGDGVGIVASILPNGDSLTPIQDCLLTPFQCIPARTGLAATNWGIYADLKVNPLAFAAAVVSPRSFSFPDQFIGMNGASVLVTLTNSGTLPLAIFNIGFTGQSSNDFVINGNSCSIKLDSGQTCVLRVAFTPTAPGPRSASLTFIDSGISSHEMVDLSGTGLAANDFTLTISPSTRSILAGGTANYAVNTTVSHGNAQNVALSIPSLPTGLGVNFFPNPITAGGSSTLTVTAASSVSPIPQELTVAGTGISVIHSATVDLLIQPPINLSTPTLVFPAQNIASTSTAQPVVVANTSAATIFIRSVVLTGNFGSDYAQSSTCIGPMSPGSNCSINVTFSPTGTGTRSATLLVIDDAGDSPQTVSLTGTGQGTCSNISDCAYRELNQRATSNQQSFYVYQDADSGFNHGFPSGLFGTVDLSTVQIDSGCLDDPASRTGCSSDPNRLDGSHETVFRLTFPPLSTGNFAGLNFQEPQFFDGIHGKPYDLTGATTVQFDVRSPDGATVQFGVGGCLTDPTKPFHISPLWTTVAIPTSTLQSGSNCPPDLSRVHLLFSVQTKDSFAPNGATVLLDNIRFLPVPSRQSSDPLALSLPVGTVTLGAKPSLNFPIPIDQAVRNLSAVYESALTVLSLLRRAQPNDLTNAQKILQALDYALHHDNHGDAVPTLPDGSTGLHSGYSSGDLGLLNDQAPNGSGLAGDVRLSGFSAGTDLCGPSGFCLVLDGANGGNNAWAILAFAAGFLQSGNLTDLNDAESIGNWIAGKLTDPATDGFKGYFVGFADGGTPGVLISGKSTEMNADIFAAFSLLAQIETNRGNSTAAAMWTARANVAGDFVVSMFDASRGRLFAGAISSDIAGTNGLGICYGGLQKGNDVINPCDFLDANSLAVLALAASPRYNNIDWTRPLNYVLNPSNLFTQTVSAAGVIFQGFDLVPAPPSTGIAWEFTGQTAETCLYLDSLSNATAFHSCAVKYVTQLLQAQNIAPFGDGSGITGSVLQVGDTLPPISQCLTTPFQCVAERPGLAATNWTIYADQKFNPLSSSQVLSLIGLRSAPNVTLSPDILDFGPVLIGSRMTKDVKLTNTGHSTSYISPISLVSDDFTQTNSCSPFLAADAVCVIHVTFAPTNLAGGSSNLAISSTPQSILIRGVGATYLLHVASGSSDSVQVRAGGRAVYQLAMEVSSRRDTITFSCEANIPQSLCRMSQTQIHLRQTGPILLKVTVSTMNADTSGFSENFTMLLYLSPCVLLLAFLALQIAYRDRVRAHPVLRPAILFLLLPFLLWLLSCGGLSGTLPSVQGTPTGDYTVTVKAVSAAGSHTQFVRLALRVK